MKMEFKLLDENENLISSVEIDEKYPFYVKTPEMIEGLEESDHIDVYNNLEDNIDILIPYNHGEDFVIQYISYYSSEFVGVDNPKELFNKSYLKSFPLLKEIQYHEILRDVYKTGQKRIVHLLYYIDNQIIAQFNETILKSHGKIYVLIRLESDFNVLYNKGLDLFYSSPDPLMIVQDKKIVKANKSIEKLTGYSLDEFIGKDYYFNNPRFNNKPTPQDVHEVYSEIINREIFNYTDILTLRHKNGKIVYTKATMQPTVYNNEPAALFYCFDITEGVEHEQKSKKLDEALTMVAGVSKIAYVYWDKKNNFEWSDEFFKLIEEKSENLNHDDDIIHHYIIDQDFEEIKSKMFNSMKEGSSFITQTQIVTKKGIKDIDLYVSCQLDSEGELVKMVGYIQDISVKVEKEKELKYLVDQKEMLIKEVHHRIKNNLQIILSLLNLDARYNVNNPQATIESTKSRINSMAIIHEKIYQSPDYAHVNLGDYIQEEVRWMKVNTNVSKGIKLSYDLDDVYVDMVKAIPLGLITSEIVHNSFNYAFPNGEGLIEFSLKEESEGLINLTIEDNGIGLPEGIFLEDSSNLGLMIINSLVQQIEGTIRLLPIKGTGYEIKFKL